MAFDLPAPALLAGWKSAFAYPSAHPAEAATQKSYASLSVEGRTALWDKELNLKIKRKFGFKTSCRYLAPRHVTLSGA